MTAKELRFSSDARDRMLHGIANRDGVDPLGLANSVIDACVSGLVPEPEPPSAAPVTGVFYSPPKAAGRSGFSARTAPNSSTSIR